MDNGWFSAIKLVVLFGILVGFLLRKFFSPQARSPMLMTVYNLLACVGLSLLAVRPCAVLFGGSPIPDDDTLVDIVDTIGFCMCYASMIIFFLFLIECTIGQDDIVDVKLQCYRSCNRLVLFFFSSISLAIREILALAEMACPGASDGLSIAKKISHGALLAFLCLAALLLLMGMCSEPGLSVPYRKYCAQLWVNVFITLVNLLVYLYAKFVSKELSEWVSILDFAVCAPVLLNAIFMANFDPKAKSRATALELAQPPQSAPEHLVSPNQEQLLGLNP